MHQLIKKNETWSTEYDLENESESIPIPKHQQISYVLLQAKYCIADYAVYSFAYPFGHKF